MNPIIPIVALALTILLAVFPPAITPWARPFFLGAALVLVLTLCWMLIRHFMSRAEERKLAKTRYIMVGKALEPFVWDADRRVWLEQLLTGARPGPISPHIWDALERARIVERDFQGPKGLAPGFEPAVKQWLKEHPVEYIPLKDAKMR